MDRSRIVLDLISAEGVRTPFNFFRTPTTYLVISLVDPMGQRHQQQTTGPNLKRYREPVWSPSMEFRLDGRDEADLRLVLELMVQSKGGDFSVGQASFPISQLRAKKNSRPDLAFECWDSRLQASDGKRNGGIRIRYKIVSCRDAETPESAFEEQEGVALVDTSGGRQNETAQRDRADLAQLVEKAGKSLRTISESRESTSEEDGEFIFDTAVGKIDLSNLQVMDNKDIVELKELGSGAFGTVYHGKWKGTDVAIKRINKNCFTSRQDRLILESLREAGILANLLHPNIVSLYGFVLDELGSSTLAIVTELVADGSLRNILRREDMYLDHYKKLIIAKGAAFGMEYLHLKRIVHFDLKCDNLLLDLKDPSSPICKVADFGLSKVKQGTLVSGGFRGTIPWMAPELLKGDRSKVSEKVDVFSFGIVMWEILTGEVPYAGMLEGEIIGGIFNDTLRPPVPTSCEPRWRGLMEECWASNPQERPSFTQIARRLHSMLVASHAEVGQ